MGTRNPGHDLALRDHGSQGHSGGDSFGNGNDIWDKAPVLDTKHLPCTSHPCLNLIGNEENAEVFCEGEELLMEFQWRHDVSALALNGLYKDSRYLLWGETSLETVFPDPFDTGTSTARL